MSVHWGGKGPGHVNRLPRGVGGFSPASLFAAGEPGAWYDPSDFSTLFQDSAGRTPVTAVAQPVGLMLDKSQGLVLGPELITNGTFDTNINGWTQQTGSISWTANGIRVTDVAGTDGEARQTLTLVVGRSYKITYTINSIDPGNLVIVRILDGVNFDALHSTTGTFSGIFTATAANNRIGLVSSSTNASAVFDDISIKLLPGNHAFQSNSGQRPTLGRNPTTGRLNLLTFTEQFDNAAWTKNSVTISANSAVAPDGTTTADKIIWTATTAVHFTNQGNLPASTTNAKVSVYCKAAELTRIAVGSLYGRAIVDLTTGLQVGEDLTSPGNQSASLISATPVGNGWWRIAVAITNISLALGVFATIRLVSNTASGTLINQSYTGDGTSGVLIWGAQLETGSTATAYQRVVSSFDVTQAGVPDLYYVNFDGTDDGMLTNTITPGIDKAQVFSGVRKFSDVAGLIAGLGPSANTTAGSFEVLSTGWNTFASRYGAAINITGLSRSDTNPNFAPPRTDVLAWQFDGAGATTADELKLRVNAISQSLTNADPVQGAGNFLAYPLYLGRRGGTTIPFNGNIYSMIVRFGANLTADQITATETWVNGKTGAY